VFGNLGLDFLWGVETLFPASEALWRLGIAEVDSSAIMSVAKSLRLTALAKYYGSNGEEYWTKSSRTYDPQRNDWLDEEGSFV